MCGISITEMIFSNSDTSDLALSNEQTTVSLLSSSIPTHPSSYIDSEVYDILTMPLGVLIVLANMCALASMIYNRHLQHPAYRYVATLALTDTGVGVYLIAANTTGAPAAEETRCVARICVVMALCVVSILCILAIAVDRYLFLIHAVYYYQLATFRYSIVLLSSIWVVGTLVGFVPLMGWVNPGKATDTQCTLINVVATEYIILMLVLFFTVPMLLIIVLYGRILHLVIQQRRRLLQQTQPLHEQPHQPRRSTAHSTIGLLRGLRAAKVVILIVAAFLLTWFPFFLATFVQIICGDGCHVMDTIAPYLSLLGFFNSLLNPGIYAFFGLEFRRDTFTKWMCMGWRCFTGICVRPSHFEPHTSCVLWRIA